jgi:hypothetical protein
MKTRFGIVTVALIGSLALTVPAIAAGGKGQAAQKQTRTMTQTQTKQQLKAGSGTQAGTMGAKTQAGKAYGPGDGTGNKGVGPKDGTGYGAPVNR